MNEVLLCDQTYAIPSITAMMEQVGFRSIHHYVAWDSQPLYDADEWVVYVAEV